MKGLQGLVGLLGEKSLKGAVNHAKESARGDPQGEDPPEPHPLAVLFGTLPFTNYSSCSVLE